MIPLKATRSKNTKVMPTPSQPADPLGVRESTAFVVERARHVRIDEPAVQHLAASWAEQGVQAPEWHARYHFFDGTHRAANWLLALDAVNFSFWSEDPADRWEIDNQGERLDGYWALAASLSRAVAEGDRPWDAAWLAEMEQGDIYRIFRGKGLIPLIADRLNNLREAGDVLQERYGGQFINVISAARESAPRLAALVARDFSSFADIAAYEGRDVRFFKRAQLLVSDIWGAYKGQGWGAFHDMNALTAFADYKLPQLLREHGVLEYSLELASEVDSRTLIPWGSPEEVEIWAATVQACERLHRALAARGVAIPPFQVDWLLWSQAQGQQMTRPYHLTRTIYY